MAIYNARATPSVAAWIMEWSGYRWPFDSVLVAALASGQWHVAPARIMEWLAPMTHVIVCWWT